MTARQTHGQPSDCPLKILEQDLEIHPFGIIVIQQTNNNKMHRRAAVLIGTVLVANASLAFAQAEPQLDSVEIKAARSADRVGVADSATEGAITARQLQGRPLLRSAEVLESVPGLSVTQHSGDGKANQYFLRGFNLDHGSDFATAIGGMPVNMVTHAHGQGYMDLNFLIPELIGALNYRKGSYNVRDGNFAVTGTAQIDYLRVLPQSFVDLSVGAHDYKRLLLAGSQTFGDKMNVLAALELGRNNGPWEQPEGLSKVNGVLRLSSGTPNDGFAITGMSYQSRWTATEQVPERAINSAEIGRFGTFAPTDGGRSFRQSLQAEWARKDAGTSTRANAYLVNYGLNLFSSPSAYLDGQHEQEDRRLIWGGHLARTWNLGAAWYDAQASVGMQWRQDRIGRVGLFNTVERVRTNAVRQDRVIESAVGVYGDLHKSWLPWLRSTVGLRFDQVQAKVTPLAGVFNADNGGSVSANQLSPRFALALGPFNGTEFYVNWGVGFHSNDVRGATATSNPSDGSPVDKIKPLARARSAELGMRLTPTLGWSSSLALWQTRLGSELVYVADQGVTEPKGASHRYGIEWWNDLTPNDWLIVDADVSVSRARFVDAAPGEDRIPNAIPVTASVALTADRKGGWYGGLRLRYLGAYPLENSGQQKSTPFFTTNIKLGYRINKSLQVTLDVLNLFDRKANDIEYWGATCTRSEGAGCNGGAGFDGRLVHPIESRTLRVSVRGMF